MQSRKPTHEELMWSVMYGDDISLVCTDVGIL